MTTAVEALAAPARLNVAVDRLQSEDASITDVRTVLHLLANSSDVDVMRTQALLELANRALGRFSASVLYAPPQALNDLVASAETPCVGAPDGCLVEMAPWDDIACSEECRALYLRAVGETR